MSTFTRHPGYVGREYQKALLRRWACAVADGGECRALVFEATGGLGKTRLLQCLPEIVAEACPEARFGPIIDLYDVEQRSAEAIERRLIEGLAAQDAATSSSPTPPQVAVAFGDYQRLAAETLTDRQFGDPESRRAHGQRLREAFVAGWNHLAAEAPLVLRFDTLEALLPSPAPPQALVSVARSFTDRELVSGWLQMVLPRLRRTLAILSGRPPADGPNPLVTQLENLGLLAAPIERIEPLTTETEIRAYLLGHGLAVTSAQVEELRRLTEGRPLLLTCWAATQGAAATLRPPPEIASRHTFEDWLVDSVLDPLAPVGPGGRTVAYCLYALSYARRGLRPAELAALLTHLGLDRDPDALATVGDLALVKVVEGHAGEPLLFLHDEIYQLIDQSGRPDDLGLREPALRFLCALAQAEVRRADDRIALLRAMANHMSYELRRDLAGSGYASYAVYVERLLREHNVEEALILSELFWATLTATVHRGGRTVQPNLAALRESDLSVEAILRDEEVRAIWLLHAQERYAMAADEADRLVGHLAADRAPLIAHPDTPGPEVRLQLALALAWAVTAARVRPPEVHEQILRRCSQVIATLEPLDEGCPDLLLRLRRDAQIGQAHLTRGQIYVRQLRFLEAMADAEAAEVAFRRHLAHDAGAPYDPLGYNLLAVANLSISLRTLAGDLDGAIAYSAELLSANLSQVSLYHRALYACQHAALLLRRGDHAEVESLLNLADRAALGSGSKRAEGMLAHCRGLLGHQRMLDHGTPDTAVGRCFARAASLLQHEPGLRLEVCRDWAAFDIDLATLYVAEGGELVARRHRLLAAELLEEYLDNVDALPPLHAAELLTLKAAVARPHAVAALLAAAEDRLEPPLPAYAHLIWGRIAIQRARRVAPGDDEAARDYLALALTHMSAFARRHTDLTAALREAGRWAAATPPAARASLAAGLTASPIAAPPAAPRTRQEWERAWADACIALRALLAKASGSDDEVR